MGVEPRVQWYKQIEVTSKTDYYISKNFSYLQPEEEQAVPDENKEMQQHLGVQLEQSGNYMQINIKIDGNWIGKHFEQQRIDWI
jgi:hypothetical protein